MAIDALERDDLPFPRSLPEFQRLFLDEAACAAYLERARWGDEFICGHCGSSGNPYRFANRLGICRCRHCNRDTSLTAGTVMERTHTPLSVWFWAAYLVASQTPGMSAVQFQRQLGLSRYETAFQILHKLRAGMVRPDQDRIGGNVGDHVEVDETWGGRQSRQAEDRSLCRARPSRRRAKSLGGFIERVVTPGATIIHLVFSDLKTWLRGIHHGVSPQHLQSYLNEFTFRFNRRFYPFNAFRSLLGIAGDVAAPTCAELYTAKSRPTRSSRLGS